MSSGTPNSSDFPKIPDHELIRPIGEGGFGEVWLARNAVGTFRAVKIVHRQDFEREDNYEREFKGLQRFEPISRSHDGFVDILHLGRNDTEGYFYYVMELADAVAGDTGYRMPDTGSTDRASDIQHRASSIKNLASSILHPNSYSPRTLRHDLKRHGHLPLADCVSIGLKLCAALEHLHEQGLVHRDIKPSNIIFVNGEPKLADIGLVANIDDARSIVGTLGYIPPEGAGTPQADLYGLGKVHYEIAFGKDRQDYPQLPPDLASRADHAGLLELNEVIVKACESDPRRRYQSATEMKADLALLYGGQSVSRLRAVERRVAILTKTSLATAVLLAIAAAGFLYQQGQTRQVERAKQTAEQLLYAADMNLAQQMIEAGGLVRAKALLEAHRPKSESTDLRGFEWYYLSHLCRDDGSITFRGHTGGVRGVAISPDGKTLVSCGTDKTIKLWDLANSKELATLRGHTGSVNAIAFSPNGETLASASDDSTVKLWNVETRQLFANLTNHTKAVNALDFSPNGKLLASGSDDKTVKVWDIMTKREIANMEGHTDRVTAVQFSPDGRRLASASDDFTVKIWNAETRNPLSSLYDKAGNILSMRFSVDGKMLAATRTDSIVFWSLPEERVVYRIKEEAAVRSVAFSADGMKLATASEATTVKLWELATKEVITTFKGHTNIVTSLVFTPDSKWLASGSDDGTAKLWNLSADKVPDVLRGHADWDYVVAFSPDDKTLATGSGDRTIKLWDVASGTNLFTLTGHTGGVTGVAFLPGGETLVTCSLDMTVRLWNLTERRQISILTGHTKRIQCLALSPSGRVLVSGTGWWDDMNTPGELIAWDLDSRQKLATLPAHEAMIRDIKFSPDGRTVATADLHGITKLWDAESFQTTATLTNFDGRVAFSPDGKTLAMSEPGRSISLWNIASRRITATIQTQGDIYSLAFSADGRTLAATHNNSNVTLLNVATGRGVVTLHGHETLCLGSAFSHDGQTFATASNDNTVRLWRAPRSESEASVETRR